MVLFQILHIRDTEQTHFSTFAGYVCNICLSHTTIVIPCESAFRHVFSTTDSIRQLYSSPVFVISTGLCQRRNVDEVMPKRHAGENVLSGLYTTFFSNTLTGLRTEGLFNVE